MEATQVADPEEDKVQGVVQVAEAEDSKAEDQVVAVARVVPEADKVEWEEDKVQVVVPAAAVDNKAEDQVAVVRADPEADKVEVVDKVIPAVDQVAVEAVAKGNFIVNVDIVPQQCGTFFKLSSARAGDFKRNLYWFL